MRISAAKTGIHLGDIIHAFYFENINIYHTTKSALFHKILYHSEKLRIFKGHGFVGFASPHLDLLFHKDRGTFTGNHINIHISAVFLSVHKFLDHQIII